jgi:hypothetical protein
MTPVKFTPDGRPIYLVAAHNHHHPNNKDISSMSNVDSLIQTLQGLSQELKRELARRLDADVIAEVSAAADATAKKTRLGRIAAARDSRNPDFLLAQGILRRAGLTVEEVTDAIAFDRLCAASARPPSTQDKMIVKGALFRLGVMAD